MFSIDQALTKAINLLSGRIPFLDDVLIAVSAYGIPFLVLVVAMQWWRSDNRMAVRHVLLSAGFAFLLGLGINQLVLLFFDRVRPYETGVTRLLIAPSADPSFPSDHSAAAMAIAASFLLSGVLQTQGLFLLAAAVLVAFSRVYVGIHYVGDVLGGAAIGIVAALVVSLFFRLGGRLSNALVRIL